MAKVKIEELFQSANGSSGHQPKLSFWALCYFFGQTALFDDLEPETWEDELWADVEDERIRRREQKEWAEALETEVRDGER